MNAEHLVYTPGISERAVSSPFMNMYFTHALVDDVFVFLIHFHSLYTSASLLTAVAASRFQISIFSLSFQSPSTRFLANITLLIPYIHVLVGGLSF